jgi:hypothetical protein
MEMRRWCLLQEKGTKVDAWGCNTDEDAWPALDYVSSQPGGKGERGNVPIGQFGLCLVVIYIHGILSASQPDFLLVTVLTVVSAHLIKAAVSAVSIAVP